jgi:ribosomal protein L7/L12
MTTKPNEDYIYKHLLKTVFKGMPDIHGISAEDLARECAVEVVECLSPATPAMYTMAYEAVKDWMNDDSIPAAGTRSRTTFFNTAGGMNTLAAIVAVRYHYAMGLKEAKDLVEDVIAGR